MDVIIGRFKTEKVKLFCYPRSYGTLDGRHVKKQNIGIIWLKENWENERSRQKNIGVNVTNILEFAKFYGTVQIGEHFTEDKGVQFDETAD